MGGADGADVADHPIGGRNGQAEQDQKNQALDIPAAIVWCHVVFRRLMNLANPCARNWQAGHSPQP